MQMNPRVKVIGATALMIVGIAVVAVGALGGSGLSAAGIGSASFDLTKILVWAGGITLLVSAILFVSASS